MQSQILASTRSPFSPPLSLPRSSPMPLRFSLWALSNRLGRVVRPHPGGRERRLEIRTRFIRARSLDQAIARPAGSRTTLAEVSALILCRSRLVSVGGSIASYYGQKLLYELTAVLAVATGASAVLALCLGCLLMVHETRLAVQSLAKEAEERIRHHHSLPPG